MESTEIKIFFPPFIRHYNSLSASEEAGHLEKN